MARGVFRIVCDVVQRAALFNDRVETVFFVRRVIDGPNRAVRFHQRILAFDGVPFFLLPLMFHVARMNVFDAVTKAVVRGLLNVKKLQFFLGAYCVRTGCLKFEQNHCYIENGKRDTASRCGKMTLKIFSKKSEIRFYFFFRLHLKRY